MEVEMDDRPRNWKWMMPAALLPLCLVWFSTWYADPEMERWSAVPLCLALVMFTAAGMNLGLYLYWHAAQITGDLMAVKNNTPEVRTFEAAQRMHPETAKALLVHRRTIWRLKYVPMKDMVDWILDEAEIVHAGFVDFVLDHSSGIAVMPKRMLSEGSKQFDPDEQSTDYEQYDALILLMQQKLMITQAFGNQAGQWIPPYSPELARHRFGLDGAVSAEPEEMSEALLAVVRAQSKAKAVNGNGGLKQLPAETPPPSPPQIQRKNLERGAAELTDEEWDAVQKEMIRYSGS
jgi:hypothetical protein